MAEKGGKRGGREGEGGREVVAVVERPDRGIVFPRSQQRYFNNVRNVTIMRLGDDRKRALLRLVTTLP